LLGGITGALREHVLRREPGVEAPEIRAMMPVYVRSPSAGDGLGNHFGLVFVPLPLAIAGRAERLAEVVRRTRALKAAPDAVVALEVLAALGFGSDTLESVAIDLFTRKASVMVTNIPGPSERVVIAGKSVTSMVVWAPVSGHLGLGLSALSYAGQLRFGVAADVASIHEPAALCEALESEILSLCG
jgi:diacylglycerol O-acyltransferase